MEGGDAGTVRGCLARGMSRRCGHDCLEWAGAMSCLGLFSVRNLKFGVGWDIRDGYQEVRTAFHVCSKLVAGGPLRGSSPNCLLCTSRMERSRIAHNWDPHSRTLTSST